MLNETSHHGKAIIIVAGIVVEEIPLRLVDDDEDGLTKDHSVLLKNGDITGPVAPKGYILASSNWVCNPTCEILGL